MLEKALLIYEDELNELISKLPVNVKKTGLSGEVEANRLEQETQLTATVHQANSGLPCRYSGPATSQASGEPCMRSRSPFASHMQL